MAVEGIQWCICLVYLSLLLLNNVLALVKTHQISILWNFQRFWHVIWCQLNCYSSLVQDLKNESFLHLYPFKFSVYYSLLLNKSHIVESFPRKENIYLFSEISISFPTCSLPKMILSKKIYLKNMPHRGNELFLIIYYFEVFVLYLLRLWQSFPNVQREGL